MSEIANLQPQAVWKNFDLLTQVPRPSGHLEKVQKFLLDWAKEKGVAAFQDEAGNIIMRKPATPGMEDRKYVTLQGHMDMVPQKTPDSPHDFENDPIEAYIDGEWVRARNTTLGADDGIINTANGACQKQRLGLCSSLSSAYENLCGSGSFRERILTMHIANEILSERDKKQYAYYASK